MIQSIICPFCRARVQGLATYQQLSRPSNIAINSQAESVAVDKSVDAAFLRAHRLLRQRKFNKTVFEMEKIVSNERLPIRVRATAMRLQLHGLSVTATLEHQKIIGLKLASLDTTFDWDEDLSINASRTFGITYRRGDGTCLVADIMSQQLNRLQAAQHRYADSTNTSLKTWNHLFTNITLQLEKCVQYKGMDEKYAKQLLWHYFEDEFDLKGRPACYPHAIVLLDKIHKFSIEDARLLVKASFIYQLCARAQDAINLLRKCVSFMDIVRSNYRLRKRYRRDVLEGIVQLASLLLQQGSIDEALKICEKYRTKISSCTDVLVNALSMVDRFEEAVLLLHDRQVYKKSQNITNQPDNGQLLAVIANQWTWGVGTRSANHLEAHLKHRNKLRPAEKRFRINTSAPNTTKVDPLGQWSDMSYNELRSSRCNIEKLHVDSIDNDTWIREYIK